MSYTEEEYKEEVTSYKTHTPYTKESLLYRDLFETHYTGLSDLIVDYWLPNQTWEGCQVTDPSARYLSNYGASAY